MSSGVLRVVSGEIVDQGTFEDLDRRISEIVRDFVSLGQALIQMRDGQHYRAGGFSSFEDYCKSKAGLNVKRARETIRRSLAYQAISEIGGPEIRPPETASQVEAIMAAVKWREEEREYIQEHPTQGPKKQKVKQPVDVANKKFLADRWKAAVTEFERRKAKAIKENKRPPVFSGKFITNTLPTSVRTCEARGFNCNPLVYLRNKIYSLTCKLKDEGFLDRRKMPSLMSKEPPALPADVEILREDAAELSRNIEQLLEILDDHLEGQQNV